MGGGLGEYDTGLRDLLAPIFLIFRVGRRLPLTNRELTRSNSSTYILTLAAFLNKKSWHTGGIPMQAEVWKREQEKAHEERRMEEMRKEIAEERKLQELQMQAAEAGHIDKVERLEFMYKGGPLMNAAEKSREEEAYLLGEKKYVPPKEEDQLKKAASAGGALLADGPAARNETWNKLNADPLLMMRMQEQDARKHVTENPVKMAQIRREVEEHRRKKKDKKRAKKEAKKEAKKAKKEAIRDEIRRKVLGEQGYAAAKQNEGKRSRRSKSDDDSSSSSSGSPVRNSRGRSRSRSRSRSRERRIRDDDRDGRGYRDDRGYSHKRGRSRSRSGGRDRDRDHRARGVRDDASAQDGSKGYGLTYANQRAEQAAAVRRERRSEWRESTKDERAAAEESARKAKEEAWAKTGGKNSVGHRTGKLTEEEKAARLRAMMDDAEVHDEARWKRLKKSSADGEKSLGELAAGAPGQHHSKPAAFLEDAQRSAFAGGAMEDRIQATKHFTQRGGDGKSFGQ